MSPVPNTFAQLTATVSESDMLQYFLTELAGKGLPTIAWQSGGIIYTLLKIEARAFSDMLGLVSLVAKGGLLDFATGDWLTLLAKSAYQLDRDPSKFAVGGVEVAVASGFGPITINPAQLWVVTPGGIRYNSTNTGVVTLPAGPSNTVIPFRAEAPGAAANVAIGTLLSLTTPIPGVSVGFHDYGSGVWQTSQGADAELDEALKARCRAKWSTIGLQKTVDGYVFLAENAPSDTRVTRVSVESLSPRGPGTVNVWIAGPAGPLSSGDETIVRNYVQARASAAADVQVQNATAVPFNVTATIYYKSAFTSAVSQATENLTALVERTGLGGTIYKSAIIEALMLPDGVVNVVLSSPGSDTSIAANEVFTAGTFSLTGSAV